MSFRFIAGLAALLSISACERAAEQPSTMTVEDGVSLKLAEYRHEVVSNIAYDLTLTIQDGDKTPIDGHIAIDFNLKSTDQPLQLDFRDAGDKLKSLSVNGKATAIDFHHEHLVIPVQALKAGGNHVEIAFTAGDSSLNRQPDFLYTLFVPDRARTAFPLFDQPNLKARYNLQLTIPETWQAIANGPILDETAREGFKTIRFGTSDLIPSYLFTFVAGAFERIDRTVDGRTMTMLHRENDAEKVARNLDAIFQLHANALSWMEHYTEIKYPFQKFGFALIPSFQYGGMEHVGAIHYRANSLLLDENPSANERLSRASLIAHETAHMWFGNLVTMDWFNDVWTKEVFAAFMASKSINPDFPEINHDLNFTLGKYPAAYSVDRSEGANAIRQYLPNLNEAGTMYGAIIYNKAPIMMKQLEHILGEEPFRQGLSQYLKKYANSNATWPGLIDILDTHTAEDLKQWSQVWVETAGRPEFSLEQQHLVMADPTGKGRLWPQSMAVADLNQPTHETSLTIEKGSTKLPANINAPLINSNGLGYGLMPVNLPSESHWQALSDLQKGALLVNLYEVAITADQEVTPSALLDFLMKVVILDYNSLITNRALGQINNLYWQYLSTEQRQQKTATLEQALQAQMAHWAEQPARVKTFYRSLTAIAEGPETLAHLHRLWQGEVSIDGLTLSERDKISLAAILAIKLPDQAADIIAAEATQIKNPDQKRRWTFISPALSADQSVRDAFFDSLKEEKNRAVESWVLAALSHLHHPLRRQQSEKYLKLALELMSDIQRTGDIFFPAGWASANFGGYQSTSAASTIRNFLESRPDYNYQLKLKILQGSDPTFRAVKLLDKSGG